MKSRMEKYYTQENNFTSRTTKNADLYKETSKSEIDGFNINSNVKVLGVNSENIDLDKVKSILEKKYQETPRRSPIVAEDSFETVAPLSLEETREYNITTILEKAKEQKEGDYGSERLKKLRNTQYDILNNLDLGDCKVPKVELTSTEEELLELINTITEKELEKKEHDPLDILQELKGDENTVVLDGLKEDIDAYIITKEYPESNSTSETDSVTSTSLAKQDPTKNEIDKSFFTNSLSFTQSDFDDFNDLKAEMKSNKTLIRVLVIIVIIAILVGFILVFNNIFEWNII